MRRSGALTGIGNPEPELMNGQSTGDKNRDLLINKCAEDCHKTFFKGTEMDFDSCDAQADDFGVKFGIEPSYFGDNLRIIEIRINKENSYYQTGHAFGYYGSGVRSKVRYYHQYRYNGKFKRFVDKWHALLFPPTNKSLTVDKENK